MGEPIHGAPQPTTTKRGYEHSDVPIRPVAMFLVGLAVLLMVAGGLTAGLFYWFEVNAARVDPAPAPLAAAAPETPGPLLQVSPRDDLQQVRQREEAQLMTPAWVDKDRGVARIPIDRALEVTAQRGLPNWPAVDAAAQPAAGDRDAREPAARSGEGSGPLTTAEGENEQ